MVARCWTFFGSGIYRSKSIDFADSERGVGSQLQTVGQRLLTTEAAKSSGNGSGNSGCFIKNMLFGMDIAK